MNYRHIYHAGCICDVVKHSVLTTLLRHLKAKEKPFFVLDTHAGVGLYDLQDERAQKTLEAQEGVLRYAQATPIEALKDYDAILRTLNPDGNLRYYPGSPVLTRHLLRPEDRLIACELHPDDGHELKRRFFNDPQVQVHHRDGYEALTALLPQSDIKRGLVFIDPPYEAVDEYERLTKELIQACKRWPTGQFAVWYPVKDRPTLWRWQENLINSGLKNVLCAEFIYAQETRGDRLNGSGMIFVNPPWRLNEDLEVLFSALHEALQTPYRESIVKTLVP